MDLEKCPLCGGDAGRTRVGRGFYQCLCLRCGTFGPIANSSQEADELWNNNRYDRSKIDLAIGSVKTCPWCSGNPLAAETMVGKRIMCEECFATTEAMLCDEDLVSVWNGEMTDDDDLKPCPMCGGKARTILEDESGPGSYRAECSKCGVSTLITSKENCAEIWNTRQTTPLDACPFCKSKNVSVTKYSGFFSAMCKNCYTSTKRFPTWEAAADAWNLRTEKTA